MTTKSEEVQDLSVFERVGQFLTFVNPSIHHPGRVVQARVAHLFIIIMAIAIFGIDLVSGYTKTYLEQPNLFVQFPSLKVIYSGWGVLLGCWLLCRAGKVRTAVVIMVLTFQVVELFILRLFHSPFEGYQQLFPWQVLLIAICAFLIHPFAGFFIIPSTIFCLWVPLFVVESTTGDLSGSPYFDRLMNDFAIQMVVAGVCFLIARNMMSAFDRLAHANEWLEKEVRIRTKDLRTAKEKAEGADRAKSEFLANMSHEIRTPMTSILGYSQLLRDNNLAKTDREAFVETIHKNSEHLLGLINEILDISKIESGKFVLQKEHCLTRKFFDDVISLMKASAQEKHLSLDISFKSDLPKLIYTDTLRLRQALLNLIGNAIKFTNEGGVKVEVELHELKERWKLTVVVSDSGIGIPADMLEAVFKPFSQADSSFTRRHGGTGLGLTITLRIAEAMGGRMEVQSGEGKGSQFMFQVYVDKVESVKVRPASDIHLLEGGKFEGRIDAKILLAEDGADNQRLLTHILEHAGANVDVAENGLQVLEKLSGNSYDMVLMDVQMPVMDGLQAAKEIRKNKNPIPIIAVTAYAMQRDEGMCLKAGCDDFISKPIDAHILLRKVAKWKKAGRSQHVSV